MPRPRVRLGGFRKQVQGWMPLACVPRHAAVFGPWCPASGAAGVSLPCDDVSRPGVRVCVRRCGVCLGLVAQSVRAHA